MRSRIVMMGILFMTMMLLLAGCGGNGGSGTPAMNEDGDQEELVMPMTAVDLAGLPSVTVPAGTSIAAGMTETFGDVTFTCPAGGEACALSQSDDGGVSSTGGAATAMLSQAAQNRRNQMNAAAMAETNGILGAIVSPSDKDDATTAQGVNLATRPGNAASEAIIVVAGNSGTNVKPSIGVGTLTSPTDADQIRTDLNAAAAIDDTFDKDDMIGTPAKSIPNQFMKKIGSDTTLGEFSGSVHEKTVDGVKDILTLYTDMANSKPLTFASYYATAGRPGVEGVAGGTGAVLGRELQLDEAVIDTGKDNSELFVSDYFPTGNSQINTHIADDTATPQNEEANGGLKFAGMFNGVSGTYECTGSTCTSATNAQGKLSTLVGTWTFTATGLPAQIKIPGVDHDSDYLAFGYWLRETTANDKTTYGVGTFANGSAPMAIGTVQALLGKAVYEGPAAGRYGVKTLDSNGQEVAGGRTVGEFTADAKLTANFGGPSVAQENWYSITGTVTGFKDGDAAIPGNWTLNLMKAGFGGGTDNPLGTVPEGLPAGTFTGSTTGNGDWQGRFFGTAGTGGAATTTLPTGVAGEFTGHFVNGHVIGAFGATKQDD
ncbi:MAG: hypothetical protein F4142_10735 [Nitrospira sp. SB0675_bin_23]|nr:hypothetical protein [Nitrospira sp. SB0675_bin_23]